MKSLKSLIKILPLSLLSLLPSCQVGLGDSVDTQAPVIKITSHKDNDSVAAAFTLRGTAYDNEGVTKITVDFTDADIHYQIVPGGKWQKKTSASEEWIEIAEDNKNFCTLDKDTWNWSIDVDTADKVSTKTGSDYSFTAVAQDKLNNSSKTSKADCSLVVDSESPDVSIYKPELLVGDYTSISSKIANYNLKDGNVISQLFNGDLVLYGRQGGSLSFKGLKVEFDNGQLQSGVRKTKTVSSKSVENLDEVSALEESKLEDENSREVYFSKTLDDTDLREWMLTVKPEEWATNENGKAKGLNTGKHLIRVVTTSLSSSCAWERKIIGYFIWYPEADLPWITAASCDDEDKSESETYECFQGSNISGSTQDDDGIESFKSTLYSRKEGETEYKLYSEEGYENPKTHQLPKMSESENVKYAAWSVLVPSDKAKYKLVLEVTDIYGNKASETRYFKTSDISAPKITIESPLDNSSVVTNSQGNITFKGKATDEEGVKHFAVVWLNPIHRSDPSNKIKYLTGSDTDWNKATTSGFKDDKDNILYLLSDSVAKEINIEKTFNLYSDLGIGTTIDEKFVSLETQDFIFRASDGESSSIKTVTLTGDTESPILSFSSVSVNNETQSLENGNIPNFPSKAAGKTATISGTWSDKFNSEIANTNKIKSFTLTWGKADEVIVTSNANGTWSATVTAPSSGGTLTAKIIDFGGNTKTLQTAASIETSELGLARVSCDNEDGSYKVGDKITINLEFTKSTDVDITGGKPTLTLNNSGTATYVSGTGTTVHAFEYIVSSSDSETSALSVSAINSNGAKWSDSAVGGEDLTSKIVIGNLPTKTNLSDTRSIVIDKTAPTVKSVTALSSKAYYKAGSSLLFMLEFSEDVDITSSSDFAINFANSTKASKANPTGSKFVLFTYEVGSSDNAKLISFSSISHDSVTVKDKAGNEITDWTPAITPSFSGIIVDTTAPSAPEISYTSTFADGEVVLDSAGVSFTVTGETGATIEYSLDNGGSWMPYSSNVSITNNGTYTVTARQTDKAGNVSSNAAAKTFTIDKGELFKTITSTTPNGTYSTNTTTKVIEGKIEFRKAVTIAQGATVTLNVKNGSSSTYKTCAIKECASTSASSATFTFDYTIEDGDKVYDSENLLNVTGLSFSTVKLDSKDVSIIFPSDGNQFKDHRKIKVITGKPTVTSYSFTGEGSAAVLTVIYDRDISKVSGNIVFEYDTTISENDFHVPAVLTASEYNELKSNTAISSNYEKGTNGATNNGTTLTNDTATKYILKATVSDTSAAIVKVFTDANKHKVTIPVISDQVEITSATSSTDGNILKVTLGETYALPVKGAQYKLTIPAGTVTDEVKNVNVAYTQTVTAAGVEAPEIRIVKPSYTITGAGNTKTASVDITPMQTAAMYLSCRTPGASIKYGVNTVSSTAKIVNSNPIIQIKKSSEVTQAQMRTHNYDYASGTFECRTTDAVVPSTVNTTYSGAVSLGSGDTYKVDTYANANGLKFAIVAKAEKNSVTSSESYEYATRSVLKFKIKNYRDPEGLNTTSDSSLALKDLKVWVTGGDSPAGENSLETCPLKWTDSSGFKMMAGKKDNYNSDTGETSGDGNTSMYGEWWWVSWDITSATYIGFVAGNVPSDANAKGPSLWYVADYLWTLIKSEYALYPGETLIMSAHGEQSNGQCADYLYDTTEQMYYYAPYYARFSFNMQKHYTR